MSANHRFSTWPLGLAALAVVVAVIFALNTLADVRASQRQVRLRQQELQEIRDLQKDRQARMAVLDELTADLTARDTLAGLLQQHLPGITADRALRESAKGPMDWIIKRYDVRIDRVPSAQLHAFLSACEQARPPVRLVDLQVATAKEDGPPGLQAQLTLVELTR